MAMPIKTQAAFAYNEMQINFEVINGEVFANATEMCQAFGKRPYDWQLLESTKRYVNALKVKQEKPVSLIETRRGNSRGVSQGTWIHQKLIIKLAQWLDVDFEIWCDEKIAELLKDGVVLLENKKEDGFIALAPHTEKPVQITNAKGANSFAFKNGNGKEDAIAWNRKVSFYYTGKMPFELKNWAKAKGLAAKIRNSGKQVIRAYRPEVAAGISISDWLHSNGAPDDEALQLGKQAIPVIQALLKYEQPKQIK